jgi:hypothetical protein
MPHDAGSGADRSYAVLLSSLLALRSDPATDHFDALLSRLEATAQLDPALARELRWWQRESVRGVEDYVASTLPVLLSSVDRARLDAADAQAMAARSWHLAAPSAEPVAPFPPSTRTPLPAGPPASDSVPPSRFDGVADPAPAMPPVPLPAQLPPRSFPAPSGLVAELPPPATSPFEPGPAAVAQPEAAATDWQRNDRRKSDRRDLNTGKEQGAPTADLDRRNSPGSNVTMAGSWPAPAVELKSTSAPVLDVLAMEVIAPPPAASPRAPAVGRFLWSRPATAPDPPDPSAADEPIIQMSDPDTPALDRSTAPPQVDARLQIPEVVDLRTPGAAAEDSQGRPRPSSRRRLLVTGLTIVGDRPVP